MVDPTNVLNGPQNTIASAGNNQTGQVYVPLKRTKIPPINGDVTYATVWQITAYGGGLQSQSGTWSFTMQNMKTDPYFGNEQAGPVALWVSAAPQDFGTEGYGVDIYQHPDTKSTGAGTQYFPDQTFGDPWNGNALTGFPPSFPPPLAPGPPPSRGSFGDAGTGGTP